MDREDFRYHVGRARAELEAGYRAGDARAAAAHLRSSALHMRQARDAALRDGAVAAQELEWMERFDPLHRRALA